MQIVFCEVLYKFDLFSKEGFKRLHDKIILNLNIVGSSRAMILCINHLCFTTVSKAKP